jgi:hypothetical protein
LYVQRVLHDRMSWLKDGGESSELACMDWISLPKNVRFVNLALDDILANDLAVSCFLEYLHAYELHHYMYLYLSADSEYFVHSLIAKLLEPCN